MGISMVPLSRYWFGPPAMNPFVPGTGLIFDSVKPLVTFHQLRNNTCIKGWMKDYLALGLLISRSSRKLLWIRSNVLQYDIYKGNNTNFV